MKSVKWIVDKQIASKDGAAPNGRLYICTTDGKIKCFGAKQAPKQKKRKYR